MKRIIDGKRYDTSTAECVAEYSNGFGPSNFRWVEEKLYRTAKGAYFLHGRGGALSTYRKRVDGALWTSGASLTPLTEEGAMHWLEERGFTRALEAHFGERVQDA